MTRTGALYLTVTVVATVGFGDLTAKTEAVRLVATGQMFTDLISRGPGARVIVARARVADGGGHKTQAPPQPGE